MRFIGRQGLGASCSFVWIYTILGHCEPQTALAMALILWSRSDAAIEVTYCDTMS